jgi:hypothetical protein
LASPGIADEGSIADIPWASVFDPDHNVRALNAIQARGFRAATDVIERLVNFVDSDGDTASEPSPSNDEQDDSGPTTSPVEQAVTAWQSVLGQLVDSLRGGGSLLNGTVKLDLRQANSGQLVHLAASADTTGSAEVWLHNGGPGDLGDVSLRCSDLLAHDGALLPADAIRVDPATVSMPDRCSRGVTIEIDVPGSIKPGRYRGTLLADGHPDVWMPVELSVLPGDP